MNEWTWEQAQTVFPYLEAEAIAEHTCFCKCGCRAPDVSPLTLTVLGRVVPGICMKCSKGRSSYLHERATSAAYIYRDDLIPSPEEVIEAARPVAKPVAQHTQKVRAARVEREVIEQPRGFFGSLADAWTGGYSRGRQLRKGMGK